MNKSIVNDLVLIKDGDNQPRLLQKKVLKKGIINKLILGIHGNDKGAVNRVVSKSGRINTIKAISNV